MCVQGKYFTSVTAFLWASKQAIYFFPKVVIFHISKYGKTTFLYLLQYSVKIESGILEKHNFE